MLKNIQKIMVTSAFAASLPIASYAGTIPVNASGNDVVIAANGGYVMTASGDCVYTTSNSSNGSKCAMNTIEHNVKHKIDVVFFDFNESHLNKDSFHKVHGVYKAMSEANKVKVTLVGHADFVGSETYNLKLSEKRAESVKKELVKLGIPSEEINTEGKGFSELMVPTAKGVKEMQNRRVEMFYTLY